MRMSARGLVLLLLLLLAVAAPLNAVGKPGKPGPQPPFPPGVEVEPYLLVEESDLEGTSRTYIMRNWSWLHQTVPVPGSLANISPQDDQIAYSLGSKQQMHVWKCDRDGDNDICLTHPTGGAVLVPIDIGEMVHVPIGPAPVSIEVPALWSQHEIALPGTQDCASIGHKWFVKRVPQKVRFKPRVVDKKPDLGKGPGGYEPPKPVVNCRPFWSPDASRIAYQHCLNPSECPCADPVFQFWVMDADGGNAHRVSQAEDRCPLFGGSWAPDGWYLIYRATRAMAGGTEKGLGIVVNRNGGQVRGLQNVGEVPDWSPDGTQVVSWIMDWPEDPSGNPNGEEGCWVRLYRTDPVTDAILDADQPLWEKFLPIALLQTADGSVDIQRVTWTAHLPKWSPTGRHVAFLGIDWDRFSAALAADQDANYKKYVEVWMVDTATRHCQRLTENDKYEYHLQWTGPNTFPSLQRVRMMDVTVSFTEVQQRGRTTIVVTDLPATNQPTPPWTGLSRRYDISTTAQYSGPVYISMTYEEQLGMLEGNMRMVCYNPLLNRWDNVTDLINQEENVVTGVVNSLSPWPYQDQSAASTFMLIGWPGLQPPP